MLLIIIYLPPILATSSSDALPAASRRSHVIVKRYDLTLDEWFTDAHPTPINGACPTGDGFMFWLLALTYVPCLICGIFCAWLIITIPLFRHVARQAFTIYVLRRLGFYSVDETEVIRFTTSTDTSRPAQAVSYRRDDFEQCSSSGHIAIQMADD